MFGQLDMVLILIQIDEGIYFLELDDNIFRPVFGDVVNKFVNLNYTVTKEKS
ncbi:hypothetical protein BCE_4578 [Bacillus cereus ATCC 10987]|uniref:Uncharacterized protein n=1 Tax=Bacillus cereus (strain ATCC 10987 / NRS 248) TaxID=222523 RepID=Q72ZT9_BACC1|nr:hypothetical protein BCE_4578 [Bacillus cereus ATCC 10987]